MKIENTRAAVGRYVTGWRGEPEVPQDCGPVHVILCGVPQPHPWGFDDFDTSSLLDLKKICFTEAGSFPLKAACGVSVRVIYPMPFDTDDDTCTRCEELAIMRRDDLARFQLLMDHRRHHDQERRERAEMKQDIDDFMERQQRELDRGKRT